jgi:SAM-dependent methyltransferase
MKGNDRLYPSIFNPRYVVLSRLRDQTVITIKKLTAEKKNCILVDFGCGDMPYRSVIEPHVEKYLGVDLEMNPKAEHHIGFDSKTTLPDNYADIILSNQVLEHVDTYEGYLQEALRILKPGGTLLLTTHGYWFYHPTPNDYWRWTSAGLRKIIEAEGWIINSFFGVLGLSASGLQLFQDGILFKLPGVLVPVWSVIMQGFIWVTDKLHSQEQRNRDSALYIVVAQKPLQ